MFLFTESWLHLRESNGLNLDIDVLGEGLDGDAAAGGLVAEVLFVLGVHLLRQVSKRHSKQPGTMPVHVVGVGVYVRQSGPCRR